MGLYLMHKDTPVVAFDNTKSITPYLVPYAIREDRYGNVINTANMMRWIRKRAIPMSRKNADKIYRVMGLPRGNSEYELMIKTHALSINDNYWIAESKDIEKLKWSNINLYNNRLSNALCELMFTGTRPPTISNNELSAEFTGQGTYAKCFIRNNDGLYLYKQGKTSEIQAEIIAGYIGSLIDIPCIQYTYQRLMGEDASVCKIYTNEDISWESAFNLAPFTEKIFKLNVYEFAYTYFKRQYLLMVLLDGLILNEDRHLQNWSFQLSGDTNKIVGLAPNYDFNRAFTADSKTISQFMRGRNLLSAARDANRVLQIDLVNLIVPSLNNIPEQYRETLYNRILYIVGTKSTQRGCY